MRIYEINKIYFKYRKLTFSLLLYSTSSTTCSLLEQIVIINLLVVLDIFFLDYFLRQNIARINNSDSKGF